MSLRSAPAGHAQDVSCQIGLRKEERHVLPEKKVPEPVMTITLTSESRDALASSERNSPISSLDKALRFFGRLNVMTLTPSTGLEVSIKFVEDIVTVVKT